jgi:hypothetical protein
MSNSDRVCNNCSHVILDIDDCFDGYHFLIHGRDVCICQDCMDEFAKSFSIPPKSSQERAEDELYEVYEQYLWLSDHD